MSALFPIADFVKMKLFVYIGYRTMHAKTYSSGDLPFDE